MDSLCESYYEVIVVGGGVNGVGVARDLSLRGVSCLLVEKNDFSAGTSGGSSGMIHGGPRYMLGDIEVTRLACLDSGFIQKASPYLLFRIPFLYPVYQDTDSLKIKNQVYIEAVEAFFKAYDAFVPLKNGMPHTRLTAKEALELEPNLKSEGLLGAITFDEWGIDVPRLCVAEALDAAAHGACALNHTEVTEVFYNQKNEFEAVLIKNKLTGQEQKVKGKILVNATGPWSPKFADRAGLKIRLRPGKGIHLVYDRRLTQVAITTQGMDGREMFIMPYENTTIIATTDDDYFGDLDRQLCTEDEIKYLEEAIERVFPAIKSARLIYTYSGVRPTLYERGKSESHLSREHEIIDHETLEGKKGVYSITGGKLASFRIIAEECVDLICKKLGNTEPCLTRTAQLAPGETLSVQTYSERFGLDTHATQRLVYRYGPLCDKILNPVLKDKAQKSFVCAHEPVTLAEFNYAIDHESAQNLADIKRRTRWAMGPCQGLDCLFNGANAFFEKNKNKNYTTLIEDYATEVWHNRACVLSDVQLKQEELAQALWYTTHSLHR